jgi:glycosyltransferase involved in cell wall biosynthesis
MIAVLTTVRNGMPFVKEAIASVRAQEYKAFRHCIVDDGSADGTSNFLRLEENSDLVVMYSEPIGRGRALNLGVEGCQADLLAILDADDVASPCWLTAMVEVMENNPDIAVLSCSGMLEKEGMEVRISDDIRAYQLSPETFLYRNPVHHSGTLIRMRALREVGGYDESRDCLFDYELWVRLMKQGKQIWRIDNGFIYKRIHPGQHFERKNRLHYLLATYRIRRSVSVDLLGGHKAVIPALLFLYGLLPRGFRHWIYNSRKNREMLL